MVTSGNIYPNQKLVTVGYSRYDTAEGRYATYMNIVEKRTPDGQWQALAVMSLAPGDVIRMWDSAHKNLLMPGPMEVLSSVYQTETSDGTVCWVVPCKETN